MTFEYVFVSTASLSDRHHVVSIGLFFGCSNGASGFWTPPSHFQSSTMSDHDVMLPAANTLTKYNPWGVCKIISLIARVFWPCPKRAERGRFGGWSEVKTNGFFDEPRNHNIWKQHRIQTPSYFKCNDYGYLTTNQQALLIHTNTYKIHTDTLKYTWYSTPSSLKNLNDSEFTSNRPASLTSDWTLRW